MAAAAAAERQYQQHIEKWRNGRSVSGISVAKRQQRKSGEAAGGENIIIRRRKLSANINKRKA
jgi:hypothetical protein